MTGKEKIQNVPAVGSTAKEILDKLQTDSPVIASFQRYADQLKEAQDKFERIFKVRRDITIESKRIIFLLHSIDSESKKEKVCAEAQQRLNKLFDVDYKKIEQELEGEDTYGFQRAVSPGNQEFVEALTLLEYLQNGSVIGLGSISKLPFITTLDYLLGLADLTGELMRRCVSSLGTGNTSEVLATCDFMRDIYTGMLCLSAGRDFSYKRITLKQSLLKVERICYNLHVLGNEVPQHMLADVGPAREEASEF